MGIGKTTITKQVAAQSDNFIFLNGDWCWDMMHRSEIARIFSKTLLAGKRELAAIEPSIARLPLYDQQATIKLDTTELTVPAAVTKMIQIINKASDLN
jgi:hypothetical protein